MSLARVESSRYRRKRPDVPNNKWLSASIIVCWKGRRPLAGADFFGVLGVWRSDTENMPRDGRLSIRGGGKMPMPSVVVVGCLGVQVSRSTRCLRWVVSLRVTQCRLFTPH